MGTSGDSPDVADSSIRALLLDPRLVTVVSVAVVGTLSTGVASPALPSVAAEFSVSPARIGLVMTAFTVSTMVVVTFTGVLADTYGRRSVVVPSLIVFGLGGVGIGVANSFAWILALRAVQGAAFAGIMPLTVTILGDLYSGSAGSTAQGIRVTANGLASAVFPLVVGALAALAWNYPFFLYALAFPAAAVAYVALPETADPDASGQSVLPTLRTYVRDLRVELRSTEIRTLIAGGFARDITRLGVMTFVPLFAVQGLGTSSTVAGVLIGLYGFVRMFVSPFTGRVVDYTSTSGALILALVASTGGVLLAAVAPSPVVLGAGVVVYGLGDGLFAPVLKNAVTDFAEPAYRAGVVNGMQLVKSGASSISPVALGAIIAVAGYREMFVVAALVPAVYAVAIVRVFR